ncbi:MAG TPA: YbaK/EbsC family protein [Candidatus Deferrimicrobiaceae bacterium]|nr:YbaK/EbsC family protein [Candidatus Deferrimicrobiaceae bacterium]
MGIPEKLVKFFEDRNIPYRTETHAEAFTAQQVAQASRVPGRAFAKSVIVNIDGKIWMAVVPATERVDLRRMQACLGAKKVRLASEAEFAPLFGDCDIGAMPIFGSLYQIPVLVSHELTGNEEIAFTAGTHRHIVRLRTSDYLAAEQPKVCEREAILAGAN